MDILRLDQNTIIDLKTTVCARSARFEDQIAKNMYYMQAVFYLMGGTALTGREDLKFKFIAVEKEYPYLVSVHEVHESFLNVGTIRVTEGLRRLKHAIKSGVWLPEAQITHLAQAPKWLIDQAAVEESVC